MSGTLAVVRAEGLRLLRSPGVLVSALFVVAVSALRVIAARASELAAHTSAAQRALAAGRQPPPAPPAGNAYAPFAEGWVAGLVVGTLLLLILAAYGVAADRERGILRLATTRSVTRGGLVLGRALLGAPLVLGLLALSGLAAWIAARSAFVFGPLVEHGYQILSQDELTAEVWRAALVTGPPLLATWCFGLLVSSVSRSAVGAVSIALAVWLGFDLFKEVLGERQYLVFASFVPALVDRSAMGELVEVARGLSDAGYAESLYRLNLLLPWAWVILLALLAWWAVSRRAL